MTSSAQTSIPFLFMRGGTSRGPYFDASDLPTDRDLLSKVLLSVIGSGHPLNIDGIGGGNSVTTKVAILSRSSDARADIDYLFAQVSVEDCLVDYSPTCGNILVGVGPASLEMGLLPVSGDTTDIRIRSVNTGAYVTSCVRTPGGSVTYDGDALIAGVPGSSSPISLRFENIEGGITGSIFPTGSRRDTIEGIAVTCIDVTMPMVIACASSFGLSGNEVPSDLDSDRDFMTKMESVRLAAGEMMGLGDVSRSVTPKFGLVSSGCSGGDMSVRYFTPWNCHPGLAVTGSQCLGSCLLLSGTVCDLSSASPSPSPSPSASPSLSSSPVSLRLEHPQGISEVEIDYEDSGSSCRVFSASVIRTARKLASGDVFVSASVWSGD